jgi:molybdopterin-guanine dinucleotide biosynthesis protein A
MVGQTHGEDIVVPWTKAGFEPLHALYNRSCLPHMLRAIGLNRLKISALFPGLSVRVVGEPSGPSGSSPLFVNKGVSIFTNINTEEDLAFAESRIG